MEKLYADKTLELDYKLREMITDDLYQQITDRQIPSLRVHIDIREDGENGVSLNIRY